SQEKTAQFAPAEGGARDAAAEFPGDGLLLRTGPNRAGDGGAHRARPWHRLHLRQPAVGDGHLHRARVRRRHGSPGRDGAAARGRGAAVAGRADVIKGLLWLVGGTSLFAALVTYPARLLAERQQWDRPELTVLWSATAALLCLVPTGLTLAWTR